MSEVRLARPADWSAIAECHRTQNERDETNYPLPPLFAREGGFAPNIALALVVERDGKVIQACWFEKCSVEMMFAGINPAGTAAIMRESDYIGYLLAGLGFSGINCVVPNAVAGPIGRRLKRAGFRSLGEKFKTFFKDLREV